MIIRLVGTAQSGGYYGFLPSHRPEREADCQLDSRTTRTYKLHLATLVALVTILLLLRLSEIVPQRVSAWNSD